MYRNAAKKQLEELETEMHISMLADKLGATVLYTETNIPTQN